MTLIIIERLLNAMLHCVAEADIPRLRIDVSQAEGIDEVKISNPGQSPVVFHFTANTGCSTGLGLARSLVSTAGVVIDIRQVDEISLRLAAPVVYR